MENDTLNSYVRNVLIIRREGDELPLFFEMGGVMAARLDGYAIVPIEKYSQAHAHVASPTKPSVPPSET